MFLEMVLEMLISKRNTLGFVTLGIRVELMSRRLKCAHEVQLIG